jgi:outer membrane PBP1 activator LpoA protein
MSLSINRLTKLLLLVMLAALLAACSGLRPGGPAGISKLQAEANAQEALGNYLGAAQLYLNAASAAGSPEKYSLQLQAVGSLIRGGHFLQAHQQLDALQAAPLDTALRQQLLIQQATLAMAEQRPDQVLVLLHTEPTIDSYRADYHRLRAEAYQSGLQFFPAAQERILLDPLLRDENARLENQRGIWDALNSLTDSELQELRTAPPPDPLSGWMELVELTRLYLQQPDTLAGVIPHWQQRYPGHPAGQLFLGKLLETLRAAGQAPEHIAILLPLSGKLASAAEAIRDGIMAAYYDSPEGSSQPVMRLYDSGATPDSTLAAYQQAVSNGAHFVIGPLLKESVEALEQLHPLPIPVLGLNQAENSTLYNPALFQFGLAPEDEAREAARLARRKGLGRGVALLPDSDWGERVYAAFAAEWQSLGGHLLEAQRYDDSQTDHKQAISSVLNLDTSKARHRQLASTLGTRLQFEPRRRQDVDFVFLVASPRQARLIRPQLSFHHASSLPVYATSRVYTGIPDRSRDSDMNGIVFCDMPWTLEMRENWTHLQQAVSDFWPDNSNRYARLYALGIDAYRILPYLARTDNSLFGSYHGVSGNLSLGPQGKVNRTLRCARFQNGLPVLLEQSADSLAAQPMSP